MDKHTLEEELDLFVQQQNRLRFQKLIGETTAAEQGESRINRCQEVRADIAAYLKGEKSPWKILDHGTIFQSVD